METSIIHGAIANELNPLLLARSASLSRLEQLKEQGRHAAAMDEAASLAILDDAYRAVLERVRSKSASNLGLSAEVAQ